MRANGVQKNQAMVTSIKIVLDPRSKKKDGTFPLKLRIVLDRVSNHINLGYSILEKDWDEKNQRVKSSSKFIENVNRFNAILNREKQKALDLTGKLQSEGRLESTSFDELKSMLSSKEKDLMTFSFTEKVIEELQEAKKYGNARVYDMMMKSIKNFTKGKDFPMRQISYIWLKKYETWFFSKGNTSNGLSVNMRTLRALMNKAIKEKGLSAEYYPFKEYSIKREETVKRAISQMDIQKLKAVEPATERQKRAKDYFFISFYMMGASFVDIASLKVKNIIGGRIEYKRKKTGHLHNIPISAPLQGLFEKYMEGKGKEDYILDIIKSADPQQQIKNVHTELGRTNKALKEMAKACGIEANMSSYVSRHSYATIAKYMGVPTAVISEALGHATEEITQVYLDSFKNEVLDSYHNMIIQE